MTPFGLKTSSVSLARGLGTVLEEEVKNVTLIYVDGNFEASVTTQVLLQNLNDTINKIVAKFCDF